ncbi:MAG: outer membrane beta-barrel protein [Prevotella sp.]|jgi:hypothetical protein|nr:outer membrane beta-barrel protein [Prevotella sp.]
MKRTLFLLLPFLCIYSLKAVNAIEVLPQDTIIKTVTTSTTTDPETGKTTTITTETEKRIVEKHDDPQTSSVLYDGSSYNVIFSWKKNKNKRYLDPHWTGIGMGFMNYDSDDIPYGSLKMSTSHNFTLNLIDWHKQFSNNLLLVSGIGTEWSRYHFDENAALTKRDGLTFFERAPQGVDYKSTKLLSYYITVPLMLEFQTSNEFHISAGPVLFFKYYSKSQVKYYEDGKKIVQNMGRDLNMRTFDLRLRAQIGFDNFAVYGYYSPYSMFEKGKGPKVNTYIIGFMLGV